MTRSFIPYSCQTIEEEDVNAVIACLRSDFLTTGPAIPAFELSVANYCGAPHAIALASGTAGLHVVCHALDIGPNSLVWTSTNSFAASANCARYLGAKVAFVDSDRTTGNLCIDALEEKLKTCDKAPDALVAVHFAGHPLDMDRLVALSKEYHFHIIEDAAHALGASYHNGNKIGSRNDTAACVFSFHPVKPVTTGEGGVIITHNEVLAKRCATLRTHGITRDPDDMHHNDGPWYYEMHELGYHYRMTDIQAALGTSQMNRLDQFIIRRRELAKRYNELLQDLPLNMPPLNPHSGWHLYVVQLHDNTRRKEIFEHLRAAQIGVNVHYIPIHLQPYYQSLGFKKGDFSKAEAFYDAAISLPIHPRLSDSDQNYICETLKGLLA